MPGCTPRHGSPVGAGQGLSLLPLCSSQPQRPAHDQGKRDTNVTHSHEAGTRQLAAPAWEALQKTKLQR